MTERNKTTWSRGRERQSAGREKAKERAGHRKRRTHTYREERVDGRSKQDKEAIAYENGVVEKQMEREKE